MAALEPLRRRGLFGHYAAWIIACTCASVVFVGALTLQDWRETFPFALFVGFCGGLAMGAVSRQLSTRNSPEK